MHRARFRGTCSLNGNGPLQSLFSFPSSKVLRRTNMFLDCLQSIRLLCHFLLFIPLFGPTKSIWVLRHKNLCGFGLCLGCGRVSSLGTDPLSNVSYKCSIQSCFCVLPSPLPPSQMALGRAKISLIATSSCRCCGESYLPKFRPCKLLTPQILLCIAVFVLIKEQSAYSL